jgi:hypothetical protein
MIDELSSQVGPPTDGAEASIRRHIVAGSGAPAQIGLIGGQVQLMLPLSVGPLDWS